MRFYMPTRLYQEENCVSRHAAELAALGTHALIVTGRNSSRKNGSLEDVISALQSQQTGFTVFDAVEENPSVETVMKARALGLAEGADFVIGIGGGSPMDAAKAIAVMLAAPDKEWDYLYASCHAPAVPVAAVPTTCGTGSEVTGVAVLTRHDLGTKVSMTHRVFPHLALADGKYLLGAPQQMLVNTAVDALSHLIETVINAGADAYSDMTAFAGLAAWRECRGVLEGTAALDPASAQALMHASSLAGMSIAQTGTCIPHALSYLLTTQGGIPHGAAVGAFQANFLRHADAGRREAVLRAAGFADPDALGGWIRTFAPVSVDAALLRQSADVVLQNPAKLATCPYPVNAGVMDALIAGVAEGAGV
ncbi:MAG: iron-containing alcohol dehydrogenase [Oscillospiraceae bacterium]|nr:iron-containing alcohol dehydrogenase [Oscillospiraceae bacterium]MBR1899046.1 iron-containing alcohol dehydrogenase [Oscillospiraceae bacterium]